jgi:hypothetical protein
VASVVFANRQPLPQHTWRTGVGCCTKKKPQSLSKTSYSRWTCLYQGVPQLLTLADRGVPRLGLGTCRQLILYVGMSGDGDDGNFGVNCPQSRGLWGQISRGFCVCMWWWVCVRQSTEPSSWPAVTVRGRACFYPFFYPLHRSNLTHASRLVVLRNEMCKHLNAPWPCG